MLPSKAKVRPPCAPAVQLLSIYPVAHGHWETCICKKPEQPKCPPGKWMDGVCPRIAMEYHSAVKNEVAVSACVCASMLKAE